ncbi:MAG: dihydropyrimidinase [Aggregatilineales bacterium]
MQILFKNGTLITAEGAYRADLLVTGEKITQIAAEIAPDMAAQVVDCTDRWLIPGGVDVHTHFDLPVSGTRSSDDFFSGGRAAAFGGTTTHIDFAIQSKSGTLRAAYDTWRMKAEGHATIDYGLHMTIVDLNEAVAAEIARVHELGITSLKLLMAYKGSVMVDDATVFRVMQIAAANDLLVMTHCENGDAIAQLQADFIAQGKTAPHYHALSRPAALEAEATARALALAEVAGCALYVVHITCQGALEALRAARTRGVRAMGETCIQYLYLTADKLEQPDFEGAKYVCSPPLRTAHDVAALRAALRDGSLQALSTDHCPFWFAGGANGRLAGKELGREAFTKIPNGVPSVEERLKLSADLLEASRWVAVNCTQPARIFGLYPRKGALVVGADADIVVWNPHKQGIISAQTHHMQVDYSVFEGIAHRGAPERVYLRGKLIVDGEQWLGTAGQGMYLRRQASTWL